MNCRTSFLGSSVIAGLLFTTAVAGASADASPPSSGPQAEGRAKATLEKVVARVKAVGRQKAFGEFIARKPPFQDREADVVCVDNHRVVMAHSGFATYVGSGHFYKDVDGKLLAPTIWEAAAKGAGTLRFTIRDEESNNLPEKKIGFFRRIKDDVCGVVTRAS
jgi:hypothetical protein